MMMIITEKDVMPRVGLAALAAIMIALGGQARAENAAARTFKTGRELLRSPQKYVGQSITVTDGYCVYDEPNIVCFGHETPFEVKAAAALDEKTLARLKEKCGDDLPGKEHDPASQCTYTFSFVPTNVKIGIGDYVLHDVVQFNKRLVLFDADVIDARR